MQYKDITDPVMKDIFTPATIEEWKAQMLVWFAEESVNGHNIVTRFLDKKDSDFVGHPRGVVGTKQPFYFEPLCSLPHPNPHSWHYVDS
jgi:hypothetical protein